MFSLETTLTGAELQNLITVLQNGYQVNIAESVGFTLITCGDLIPTAKMTIKQLAVIAASKGVKIPPRSKKSDYLTALGIEVAESTEVIETAPVAKKVTQKAEVAIPLMSINEDSYISIAIKELRPILQEAKKFVPKKPTHLVLQYYKLVVNNGIVELYATSLDSWYKHDLYRLRSCNHEGNWEALISPAELESLCKGSGYLYITPTRMFNDSASIDYFINQNIDEYPTAPVASGGALSSIVPSAILTESGFAHSVKSKDETRMILTGVNYKIENNTAVIASTDGHRLFTHTVENIDSDDFNVTIKQDLSTLKWDHEVLITRDEDNQWYSIIDTYRTVTIRNMESKYSLYPKYWDLLPKQTTEENVVDIKSFTAAVKQTYVAAGKDNDLIRVTFSPASNQILMLIEKDPRNKVNDVVSSSINCQVSEEFSLGLNTRYLTLDKFGNGGVTTMAKGLYPSEDHSPLIVKSGGSMYLLMNIKIKK